MRETQFRNKITWFSFAFSLLVIWVHSYNAALYLGDTSLAADMVSRIERGLGEGVGQIAVPGFFMISGYLFYRNCTWDKIASKLKRRVRSVLVPYIVWNFLYYLGYVIASRLPWLGQVVGKGVIPFNLLAAVDAIIHYTYNYVFWYLFQLVLLILLAPVLYPVLRMKGSRVVLFAFLWVCVALDIRLPYVNADALIYYSTGAVLSMETVWRERVEAPVHSYLLGSLMAGASILVYWMGLRKIWIPCFVVCRLLGAASVWLLIPGESLPKARPYMHANFFLYATHFAQVRLINKVGARFFTGSPAVALGLYVLMPFLVLGITWPVGKMLQKSMPSVWGMLNGGR